VRVSGEKEERVNKKEKVKDEKEERNRVKQKG